MSSFKTGVPGGFVTGARDAKIANSIGGVEADRKLRGLPDQKAAQTVFGKSPVERPLAATPTNPKSGTLVRSPWSSGR